MKTHLLKRTACRFITLLFVFVSFLNVTAQNGEMLQGGGMETADEAFWTVNYYGTVDQPTIEFGSSESCAEGNGSSLRITCAGTEYANIILTQEVQLKPNTVYMVSAAIKDLTGGLLQNWWAQLKLKLKQGDNIPDDENDGIKLYGFNFWLGCIPVDGTFQDDACDTYGLNEGEEPDLTILDQSGALVGIKNFVTPDTSAETLTYYFAIVTGIWTDVNPLPYDIAIDEVSLVDSVESSNPSVIRTNDSDKEVNLTNFPNPFNGLTTISYNVKEISNIKLTVYNILGEEVASLFNGIKTPGAHTAIFDATGVSNNMLFCKLQINDKVIVRKMTLMK